MAAKKIGRSTIYNNLTSPEEWANVSAFNKKLLKDFLNYCVSVNRSNETIKQYEAQLRIFFVWNEKENGGKDFVDVKKRDFIAFFGWGSLELGWSPNRLAALRSVLSSLSNYIERILDDEYPSFHNIVKVLEPIKLQQVREKTIVSPEEVEAALEKLMEREEYEIACWLALLYSSGMRKAETLQMQVSFFKEPQVVFDVMYKTPKIRTKGAGRQGKEVPRYIFIYTFEPYLRAWLAERDNAGLKCPYLFCDKATDAPITINGLNAWIAKIGKIMGVNFYPHSMRHLWTTKLKRGGYPDSVIQKLQHWADPKMVSVYNDMSEEEELEDFFAQMKGDYKE